MRSVREHEHDVNMEVFVCFPGLLRFSNSEFPVGSLVQDVLDRFIKPLATSCQDFYVSRDGRRAAPDEVLCHGAVYHLETRLCGGKGGFGSMLRALGAQIEKTTNREACRDLSGRRLRDVNHEKEMAEWLKKQAERDGDKEQRRLERLHRKLKEPTHTFTSSEYEQQRHDLSERLEASVLQGLQASSSSQLRLDDDPVKRPVTDECEQPHRKKRKMAAACFWTGVDELDDLSSEEEDGSPSSCGTAVATTTQEEQQPEQSDRVTTSQSFTGDKLSDSHCRSPPQQDSRQEEDGQLQGDGKQEEDPERRGDEGPERRGDEGPERQGDDDGGRDEVGQCQGDSKRDRDALSVHVSLASCAQELESLGLDVLKQELMSRGLKCGGTLAERAARLFAVRGLSAEQIDPALLVKPRKK